MTDKEIKPWRIWRLIPASVESVSKPSRSPSETLGSGSLPSYDVDAAMHSSTHAQRTELESEEFGTIVKEVTVVTTTSTNTVTTQKRYRVEDA